MTLPVEYWSIINFLLLRNTENAKIIEQLQEAYKEKCSAYGTIYKWIQLFKNGRQFGFDRDKEGKPCEIPNEKKTCGKSS